MKNYYFGILFFVSVFFINSAFAQGGNINGVVIDKNTGETLVGVSINISEVETTIQSDFDGNFASPELVPGQYSVKVSYISYKTLELKNIILGTNGSLNLTLKLERDVLNTEIDRNNAGAVYNSSDLL